MLVKRCFFSFSFKGLSLTIAKTSSAQECKLSKHERILSQSIFGTLHRYRFHLSLARKLTPRSCYWKEFEALKLIWLVFFNLFLVKLQFNQTLSEINVFLYIVIEKKCQTRPSRHRKPALYFVDKRKTKKMQLVNTLFKQQ